MYGNRKKSTGSSNLGQDKTFSVSEIGVVVSFKLKYRIKTVTFKEKKKNNYRQQELFVQKLEIGIKAEYYQIGKLYSN